MKDILLVVSGVVGTIIVEIILLVIVAVRRALKEGGPNSRVSQRETVVPVLKQE